MAVLRVSNLNYVAYRTKYYKKLSKYIYKIKLSNIKY